MLSSRLAVASDPTTGNARRADDVLTLLARAVRQFHTYPPASPLCRDAVTACLDALVKLDDCDQLQARVHPTGLILDLDETPVGTGTVVEQELSRRLHRAGVAAMVIDRAATPRDVTRFCCDLLAIGRAPAETAARLDELLHEHGVDKVAVVMAHRPEVLTIGAPSAPILDLVARERTRREAMPAVGGPAAHLYPPDKGWVRMDPFASLTTVSLEDLALLVDDPGALATMLMRLTDEELPERDTHEIALSQKFSDLATVFAALEPRLARVMFGRLAQAVLALDETRRRELLRRTILPALLDGKVDGTILRDFPDVELADSLCLLLDLETAAPEVLATALDRLELGDERRAAVAPLLEDRARDRARSSGSPAAAPRGADEYARKLIDVRPSTARSFSEFAAFDLAIDDETAATVNAVVEGIRTTDVAIEQVRCLRSLVRIEPNPTSTERFLARSGALAGGFERAGRWTEVATWARDHGAMAQTLREHRPDVADTIDRALADFCTAERVGRLLELTQHEDRRDAVHDVVRAFGAAMVPAMLHLLATAPSPQWTALVHLLCADAARVATALNPAIDQAPVPAVRAIVRVLGHAGAPYARRVGELLSHPDDQVAREALRALARIATAPAAALVAARVRAGSGWLAAAAEETLWHFPPAEARRQARDLLDRREFVMRQPATAGRLLDRLSQQGAAGLESTLRSLAALRFRLWNPALVRVARKAHALAGRHA